MPKTAKRKAFERAQRITQAQNERRAQKRLHDNDPGWCRACKVGFKDASALASHRRGRAHKAMAGELMPEDIGTPIGATTDPNPLETFVGVARAQERHNMLAGVAQATARGLGRL